MKRLMVALWAVLLLSVLLATAADLQALEIVFPADQIYFERSSYLIIKGGEPPVEGMTIEINGVKSDLIDISSPAYKKAFADFLIVQPEFAPGKNRIAVDGYAGGQKVSSASATAYYLDSDPFAIPPKEFQPFVMHLPQKEALCAPCHNMNPDQAELRAESAAANPCASCHRGMLAKKHVHGPAGVYRCSYCHDPQSKPGKYRARGSGAALCNECHQKKTEEFQENKFVHGPVGVGLCIACHDPHASEYPAQLVAPVNEVCLGCHETIAKGIHVVRGVMGGGHPLKGVPDPSNPGRELSCASCHDPHGGMANALFRNGITGRFALCQICHKK